MLTTREVRNVLVCHKPAKGKEYTADGLPRRGRKIGKVSKTVFDPSGMRVVGFVVKRPDLLWMFKRADRFLALDAMDAGEGVIRATMGGKSWDDAAIQRCGLDWDACILWEGMRTRTTAGEELGRVDDISFDPQTGEIASFFLDDGGTARALIGSVEIPADLVIGYKDDFLVVKPEAAQCKLTGGLAAKAGTATAKVGIAAKEGGRKAGAAASKAVDAGAVGLGKGIGRIKNSFTGFADEFKKEAPAPKARPAGGDGAKAAGRSTPDEASAPAKAAATAGKSGSSSSTARKAATSSAGKKASATASTGRKAAGGTTPAAKKGADSASSTAKKAPGSAKGAGKAVTDHLKGASTMFSDFKKEFDKASGKE